MIDVEHATKRYHSITAVNRVSFTARDGEVLALLGPNGAGKTSLVRMIMGITAPDGGRIQVTVDDRPAARYQMGYLPEERGLHKGVPIRRVLAFFGRLQGMSARDAEAAAQAWLERLGLGDRTKAKIDELSRGNQQKVQFAASVLHRPRIAVLDEPFAGLDPVNQELFIGLIHELRDQGTTVLLSAHQMSLVEKVADRVILLGDGEVVLAGTLDEIQRDHGAGEVYTLQLTRAIDTAALSDHPRVLAVDQTGPTAPADPTDSHQLRVVVASGQPLGEILSSIEIPAIARIASDQVTLHDIYVEAVTSAARSSGTGSSSTTTPDAPGARA